MKYHCIVLLFTMNILLSVHIRCEDQLTNSLIDLAKEGDLDGIKKLLSEGADIERTDSDGFTALCAAVANDHYAIVKYLIENGADVNASKCNAGSILILAVMKNEKEISKLLIENGANVNATGSFSWTPLHWAAQNNDYATMKILIEKGAIVDAAGSADDTPLIVTVSSFNHSSSSNKEQLDMVELLIKNGANDNAADENGTTALHEAAREGFADVVKLLLQHGADPKKTDNHNKTAKDIASKYDKCETVGFANHSKVFELLE